MKKRHEVVKVKLCKEQFSFPMGRISALFLLNVKGGLRLSSSFLLSLVLSLTLVYGRNPATCQTSWVNLTLLCSCRNMSLFVAAVLRLLCFYCALSGVYSLL